MANPSQVDAGIASGLGFGAKVDPEPISKALLAVGAVVAGLFGAAHTKAVLKEGQTLNSATPTFLGEVQATMSALSQGAITEDQAISYLQQAQVDFETAVKPIIKDNGKCIPGCYIENGNQYIGPNGGTHCCSTGSSCNGPCCIRCGLVIPTVDNLISIIQAGGGGWTIPATVANAANKATPAVAITYTRASTLTQIDRSVLGALGLGSSTGTSGSNSTFLFVALGLGAFLLFALLRK